MTRQGRNGAVGAFGLGLWFAAGAQAQDLAGPAQDALIAGLVDQYHTTAVYGAIADTFADPAFAEVLADEEGHLAAVIGLLETYGLFVPDNPYLGGVIALEPVPGTLEEAYAGAVVGELANITLFRDDLIPAVDGHADIVAVFTDLVTASETAHLPLFQACLSGDCAAVTPVVATAPEAVVEPAAEPVAEAGDAPAAPEAPTEAPEAVPAEAAAVEPAEPAPTYGTRIPAVSGAGYKEANPSRVEEEAPRR